MKFKKPMRACHLLAPDTKPTNENIIAAMRQLRMPVMATVKMDGIRAFLFDDLTSRTLKKIPNEKLRERARLLLPRGADMELWNKDLPYHEIESIVMSKEHPDWEKINFHLLDMVVMPREDGHVYQYVERMNMIGEFMQSVPPDSNVKFAPPLVCHTPEELLQLFLLVEEECGEGICWRTFNSPYKQGKCTPREQYLFKLCRWAIEEAEIIGFKEQEENGNPDRRHATGAMNRSKAQDMMYGKDTLGAFIVRKGDMTFTIGTGVGLTDSLRKEIWMNQDKYLGKFLKYKCKKHGEKHKPRSPVYWGLRNMEIDG